MKKLIFSTLGILIGLCLNISTAQAQNCLDVYFDNGDGMCLNMNKDGNNYKIYPTRYFGLNNQNVVCYVILPNNVMQKLDSCKGTFTYNGRGTQNITISAMYNADNTIYNNRLPASVNFNDGSWSWRTYPIDYSKYSNKTTYNSNYNTNYTTYTNSYNTNYNNRCSYNKCNTCNDYYCTYSTSNTQKTDTQKTKTYNNKLELESNDLFPDIDQWINLSIETDDDYTGTLYLSAEYRSPINTERVPISNRSSTYFYDYSATRSNGKYEMIKSDDGEIKLKNLIKFKKFGYYRIYVKDRFGKEAYIQFSVENTKSESYPYGYGYSNYDNYNKTNRSSNTSNNSASNEFTSYELNKITEIYDNRDHTIAQLQRLYPNLKKDYYWISLSNNLSNDMRDVVNNKRHKNLDDYDDFLDAYNDRYRYTMQNI